MLARVGSPDYFDDRRAGQVDMTRAVRSPGSTLKPFIYGLAFEDGFVHPESLIDDRPIRFGSYAPENFDMTFQGTVPVRKALQMSLNVPAVALLDRVGASRLSSRLKQAGANLELPKDEAPGLAMGLGGVGITLQDLVQLYSGLARLGDTRPLREIQGQRDEATGTAAACWIQVAAWQVGNVLLGTPPPENGVRNRIAFKTGTSYGYRDAWSIGFDGRITIGVWVGRPDGAPVPGIVGRTAAAPILFDAFARTGKLPAALPKPPKGTLGGQQCQIAAAAAAVSAAGRTGSNRRRAGAAHPVPAERVADRRFRGDGASASRDACESGRWRASDHHARQWDVGRGTRWPPPATGQFTGSGLRQIDRHRRQGRGGHSCRQSSVGSSLSGCRRRCFQRMRNR